MSDVVITEPFHTVVDPNTGLEFRFHFANENMFEDGYIKNIPAEDGVVTFVFVKKEHGVFVNELRTQMQQLGVVLEPSDGHLFMRYWTVIKTAQAVCVERYDSNLYRIYKKNESFNGEHMFKVIIESIGTDSASYADLLYRLSIPDDVR